MNIEYPNPQFKTLNKAIASNDKRGEITYYYGSDSKILDLEDYNEYGWEFIVDKYKFNSEFLLNYLPDSSKELIGNKLEDIDKIEKTLFPTLVDQKKEEKSNIKYFGSITIGRQKLIMISVPCGYNKLNLFDTTIDNTNPKITVTFSEKEEINSNKIVWFVITSGDKNEVLDINLSFFSWENSINPHRNMNRYLLRNDEFHNTLADLNIFDNLKSDKENPLYVDLSSNTIVGNKRVDVFPEGSRLVILDSNGEEKNGIGIEYDSVKKLYTIADGFCIGVKTGNVIKIAAKYRNVSFSSLSLISEYDIWQGSYEATAGYVESIISTYSYPSTFTIIIKKLDTSEYYYITNFLGTDTTLLNEHGLCLKLSDGEEKADLLTSSNNNLREVSSIIQSKLNKYKGDSDEDWDKYKGNPRWDRYITYSEGQEVKYLGVNWTSLENNNRGNRPDTSSLWLKSSMFSDDFKAKRVMSVVRKIDREDSDQSIPGYVFPSVFTVPILHTNLKFSITYLNGYKLKSITDSYGLTKILGGSDPSQLDYYTPSQLDYDTYTSEDQTTEYEVSANMVKNPGAALMFSFTKIRCPLKVKIHHPTASVPEESYEPVKLKDSIDLRKIIIDTANTNIVGLEKDYYIGGEKVNSRMLNIPTPYPAKDREDGSSYIDIEDVADLPAFYEYNIYLETIYYTISISDHVGFYVDKSEIIVPKTNTSVDVNVNYRISPTNGVLSEGIKYRITYPISEGKEYDSSTVNYNPSISASSTVTVNGVIYTITTVNSSYFNLRISGKIDRDIKIKIWK